MKVLIVKVALLTFLSFLCTTSFAQLNVTTGLTPTQYVQSLLGAGVTISNVNYQGGDNVSGGKVLWTGGYDFNVTINQIGSFSNGGTTNLGLSDGIVLSTGDVDDAAHSPVNGQHPSGYPTYTASYDNDLDLRGLVNNYINNCSVLEFDFVPQGNTIEFQYVFASSEYPTFVNSSYNDVFGFFLSGPGISGPFSNNSVNIATVPSTTTPVAINNLNNGGSACSSGGPSGPCQNCAYYVDNCGGSTISYHGFTTVMTATYNVTCGETYHIKLAIGDVDDVNWDSAVFLKNNSFTSNASTNTTQSLSVASCEATTSILNPAPIDGEPGFTYLWNTGATTPTITVNNGTGPYLVAVTDACGAVDTVNFVINCPLSVNLKNFDAQKEGKRGLISWKTASERNNDYFIIERSGEDGNFSEISRTPAKGDGNSNILQSYSTYDMSPLLGVNYYRLISVDEQGIRSTSEIKSLNFKGDGKIEIAPNPNNGTFNIAYYFSKKDLCVVEVYSASGELALYKKVEVKQKGYKQISFVNKVLPKGFYYIKLHTNDKVILEKMLVE